MRIILILVGLLFVNSGIAEPKSLVCSYTDMKGLESSGLLFPGAETIKYNHLPLGMSLNRYEEDCDESIYSASLRGTMCKRLEKLRAFIKTDTCKDLGYLARNTFTLDTDDLNTTNESNAEFFSDNCGENWIPNWTVGVFSSDIKRVAMTATPSFISFQGAHSDKVQFNIDRKTLKGGYAKDRSWQCKIEDIDTSENLI